MGFKDVMAKVVGQAITSEEELSGPWNEYKNTKEVSILQKACGYGQQIPDTKLGTYYYSLVYQKQHYDALATVLSLKDVILPTEGRCLMVDFGAGPGTAALAWAAHIVKQTETLPKLSYVRLDQLAAMEPLCKALFNADDNLGDEFLWWDYRSVPTELRYPQRWVENADYVVFVFSYVLCQSTVKPPTIREFAQLIVKTCEALGSKPAYLLMVDAKLSTSSWPLLLSMLRRAGMTEATATKPLPTLDYRAVYLNPDGKVRDSRDNAGRTVYDVIRLQ